MSRSEHPLPARRGAPLAVTMIVAVVLATFGVRARADADAVVGDREAHVSYVAGGSVYVDAGRMDGLREADTLRVVRGAQTIARLWVSFASAHRAVCDTLMTLTAVHAGDVVRFRPGAIEAPETPLAADRAADTTADSTRASLAQGHPDSSVTAARPGPEHPALKAARAPRVRGRVAARVLSVRNDGLDLLQPSGEIFVDARDLASAHVDLTADLRARATTQQTTTGELRTRRPYVNRLSATLRDRAGHEQFTLGRQATPVLSGASVLDGARLEWTASRWRLGGFSGVEPDPALTSLNTDIVDHGVYASRYTAPERERRWMLLAGAATSLAHGAPNRDYGFVQGGWNDARTSVFVAQEVDLNRGWKRAAGEPPVVFTSALATAYSRPVKGLTLNGGYDDRRNVRLYRDRETPETQFDDAHRRGGWLGLAVEPVAWLRVSGDERLHRDPESGNAWSTSGGAELIGLTAMRLGIRLRGTNYASNLSHSLLWVAGSAIDPLPTLHVDLSAGTRSTLELATSGRERTRWESCAADLGLSRRWYLTGSWQRDHGGGSDTRELFSGLMVRF